MAHGVGVQGLVTSSKCKQICINILPLCEHQQKTRHPKLNKILFISNYKTLPIFRGFEQLSSSISWRVMALSQNGKG